MIKRLYNAIINDYTKLYKLMAEDKKDVKSEENFGIILEEMAKAGLHLGHHVSKINPKMKPYIFGPKNDVNIIDLDKTAEKFTEALKFIGKIISENKFLLLVGTKIQIKNLLKETAKECGLPYVNERWLGGLFTNFGIVKKRMDYFKDLEKKKGSGDFEKYTKKERAKFEKELRDLERKCGGIKNLEKLPDAIFVCDMIKDETAIKEAGKKNIPIIAITDTNTDPSLVDFPIPANDDAITSVKYILEKIKEVILKNRPAADQPKAEKLKKE